MKKIFLLLLVFSVSGFIFGDSFRKEPYLIYRNDAKNFIILWQTYRKPLSVKALVKTADRVLELEARSSAGNLYSAEITGLEPGREHQYEIRVNGSLRSGAFMSPPESDSGEISFYAYGDSRSFIKEHDKVVRAILKDIDNGGLKPSFLLHTGDLTINDSEAAYDKEFFNNDYSIKDLLAKMPIMACRGNHEAGAANFRRFFPYDPDLKCYYSFDWGQVHITVIDHYTDIKKNSAQYAWIENDIKNSAKPFKIVMIHEPGWGTGIHPASQTTRALHESIFKEHGVQLVIAGHNHNYSRAEVDGITHLVLGGGGAPLYEVNPDAEKIVKAVKAYNFGRFVVKDNGSIEVTVMDENNNILDSFFINNG